jgi:hypothetical protein
VKWLLKLPSSLLKRRNLAPAVHEVRPNFEPPRGLGHVQSIATALVQLLPLLPHRRLPHQPYSSSMHLAAVQYLQPTPCTSANLKLPESPAIMAEPVPPARPTGTDVALGILAVVLPFAAVGLKRGFLTSESFAARRLSSVMQFVVAPSRKLTFAQLFSSALLALFSPHLLGLLPGR